LPGLLRTTWKKKKPRGEWGGGSRRGRDHSLGRVLGRHSTDDGKKIKTPRPPAFAGWGGGENPPPRGGGPPHPLGPGVKKKMCGGGGMWRGPFFRGGWITQWWAGGGPTGGPEKKT